MGSRMRPLCPGCGEPVGVYEPLWAITREAGAELTSWLQISPSPTAAVALWHASCAEGHGIPGG
jgi:hypothetical protein